MSKKEVRCKILGHSDGPKCEDCGKPMDSIKVLSKDHNLYNKEAHYCYHCTLEGR